MTSIACPVVCHGVTWSCLFGLPSAVRKARRGRWCLETFAHPCAPRDRPLLVPPMPVVGASPDKIVSLLEKTLTTATYSATVLWSSSNRKPLKNLLFVDLLYIFVANTDFLDIGICGELFHTWEMWPSPHSEKPVGSEVGGRDPRPWIASPVGNQACIVPRLL